MKPKLSILIVSYNTREMTLACLRSVHEQAQSADFEIVLVDNASVDGSAGAVAAAFPQVRLLAETENHGFARANNLAAKVARGDYLLLLNPDTLVLDQALDKLVAFAEQRPEAGIWGGRTLFGDGSLNPTSCWRRPTLWSLFCRAAGLSLLFPRSEVFNPESYGGWRRDTVRHVDIVTGCLFLIRRATWERLGGFSSDFFMYGEETDLCLRARALGCRPAITPDATILHYGGASEKTRAGKVVKLFAAKIELIRRHWPVWQRGAGVFLMVLWALTRHAGYALLARLTPTVQRREEAAAWAEVWRQRRVWRAGYRSGRAAD
ncbi:glycosyltransferase family 2 protein [Parvibaculum sp.]|uniref:glycosyltransferase family 2 protein n=1 Tax=Parvibaculum sp. TaxID=2024848 RepID=UPI0034A0A7A5